MKCKHNWQSVNLEREKEYNLDEGYIIYKDWIVTFVCSKCYKLKDVITK